MQLDIASKEELKQLEMDLSTEYLAVQKENLNLDLTRGKPSPSQVSLSDNLDGILAGDYFAEGTDTRNYGGLLGLQSARQLGADLLGIKPEQVLAGGNSSLTLMYFAVLFGWQLGPGDSSPWKEDGQVKFICPVPGYDRHFAICQQLGIEMINVQITEEGPNMDEVEQLIKKDRSIKGIWCVPKYQNPTGVTFSSEVVERIAKLGQIAASGFRIFWDNAYAAHEFKEPSDNLSNLYELCEKYETEDSVYQFASTSKITFAGAGIAFMGASESNLSAFVNALGITQIGPDKVNQLRHMKFIPNINSLHAHMKKHGELLAPKFEAVLKSLENHFSDNELLDWTTPNGGYFISVNTKPGLAKAVVSMAGTLGVKLTPAGATFPYGRDPENSNIRLAPSFPTVEDVEKTMEVFVLCVKLASVRQKLGML